MNLSVASESASIKNAPPQRMAGRFAFQGQPKGVSNSGLTGLEDNVRPLAFASIRVTLAF